MKLRTTILLLLVTAGLAAFVIFWEHHQPATAERLARENYPFLFDPKDADTITLADRDQELLLRREEDGLWYLTKPAKDRANQEAVQQLLAGMSGLEWLETLKRSDMRKEDFKRAGLGDSATEVVVRRGKEQLARCFFGSGAPLENTVYASMDSRAEEFHLARTTAQGLLTKTADEWRDTRLTRLSVEHVGRFSITAGTGTMEFVRKPGEPWRFVKPLQTRASVERLNSVIQALLKMQVKPNGTHATPARDGGQTLPPMKVVLGGGAGQKPLELTFQPPTAPGAEIVAEASNRNGTFLAPPKLADFWKLQPNHLRDLHLAQVDPTTVTSLRIRSLAFAEVKLDRQGETWMLSRFGKVEPANEQRIARLFEGLNSALALDFITDAATALEPYGLDKPMLAVEWTADGKTKTLQFGQGEGGLTCAKYTDEPSVYKVNPMMLPAILPPDSVKWRGTRVVNASLFSVRRIIIKEGDNPSLILHYNPDDASWTASIADRDVTPTLDKAGANALLNKLSSFEISDWSSDRSAAIQALKNPTLTVQLLLVTPGSSNTEPEAQTLTFAPSTPGMNTAVYHGRINDDPDTFLISRDLYREISRSLTK